MTIHIYNSLTKKKEELSPLDGKTVKMYSCGVTVYDKCHIGHARSLYIFDVIRRYLKHRGHRVLFVRNITDVDDKIINKAKELNKSFDEVVRENIDAYERDLEHLGVDKADVEPRATQYIPKIIAFVEELIKKDFAYEVDGDVYYSVRKFESYGKLSGQSIDQMVEATRIGQDPKKRDPLDFALWKKAKEGEKSWPSPWGEGRPGWHIECSCMSMNELKSDTIDIHAGGRDLIFPHHENEIAQSEALTGKPFAKHWIHHGLLTINGQKMAKSLGNFITLDEILEKYSRDVLKLFFLQSHYASSVDFSWEKMEEVEKGYERISILMAKLNERNPASGGQGSDGNLTRQEEFQSAMDDDFNTPKALSVIYDVVNECNKLIDSGAEGKELMLRETMDFIKTAADIFGVNFLKESKISDDEKKLLEERSKARKSKDFQRSDELRDLLKEKGIVVEDTKEGQVWRRA
ncbi:MAG: cysteine--tRNA ligase [Candidatus Omnitrophica bacterium]|nr:cysteine--tRNA ligase [Candidatus Omnitrophota bacterium]